MKAAEAVKDIILEKAAVMSKTINASPHERDKLAVWRKSFTGHEKSIQIAVALWVA